MKVVSTYIPTDEASHSDVVLAEVLECHMGLR